MPDLVLMSAFDLLGPVGAFGKMPSQGDFFWIDLPQGFAPAWDKWLSGAMAVARARLGERWQECYYSAPIWRFTLAPQMAGGQALMGVLMPSVDRVGRAFPLTLVVPISGAVTPERHMAQAPGFEALEGLALAALEFSMTQDGLRTGLSDLHATFPLIADGPVSAIPEPFDRAHATGYWSALIDGQVEFIATPSLPTADQLVAMFDLSDRYWAPEAAG